MEIWSRSPRCQHAFVGIVRTTAQGICDGVFPASVKKRLAVEAGVPMGWQKYVGDSCEVLGITRLGASAPGEVVMREYGFTGENVFKKSSELLAK